MFAVATHSYSSFLFVVLACIKTDLSHSLILEGVQVLFE